MEERIDRYNVVVSNRAANMLVLHASFLAREYPDAADGFIEAFSKAKDSLACFPRRCPWLVGESIPRNRYRKLIFNKRYLIIFEIDGNDVFLEYVLDTKQDYAWLLM